MGWRDWNQFQGYINQDLMELAFHGLADTTFGSVGGKPTSLAHVGYNDAGLDDVWQKCGKYGPENYTYHDAAGSPDSLTGLTRSSWTDVGRRKM